MTDAQMQETLQRLRAKHEQADPKPMEAFVSEGVIFVVFKSVHVAALPLTEALRAKLLGALQ